MEKLTYTITINQPQNLVFNKITDKSIYPDWAKAWGDGMTYEGEWKKGGNIHFDNKQGGTKVILEEFKPNESLNQTYCYGKSREY